MAEANAGANEDTLRTWYTGLLDHVVKEMIKLKAVEGIAVQASPVWMVPNEVLMAKVWAVNAESDFVWTLSIDKFLADFIAGSLAATPRDAARHFSMKWQLDADRLVNVGQKGAASKEAQEGIQMYANRLIGYAEAIYELTLRDEQWDELPELGK